MYSQHILANSRRLLALYILLAISCRQQQPRPSACNCTAPDAGSDQNIRGALLGTRFESLEALKSVVQIEYEVNVEHPDSLPEPKLVRLRHCSGGREVVSILERGTSQNDILKAKQGTWKDRLSILVHCPFAITHRKDLGRANALSRWRPQWFGEGDLAFFDLAKSMVAHINTPELAFKFPRDSTEKGYLNSFNHITSQVFITACFSEELADFIGDAHERAYHPELISGKFSPEQLQDLKEGPVDNYVDMVNNEWGQELGKQLRKKYQIHRETPWTPELLACFLNDLQAYYSWAFQLGFEPYRAEDELVRKFSGKLDAVLRGHTRSYE